MLTDQRVIFSDNGTLNDISMDVDDFRESTATIDFVNGQDYIYIASVLPFNHRYIDISTANDQASVLSVDYWTGVDWQSAVDVIDKTDSGGVTLAQSGIIQFTTDIDEENWLKERESKDVTGLSDTYIYHMYWVRLNFSADLKNTTAINYIGHKFSEDIQLYGFYPDLNNSSLKIAFASGKTTWDEQHFAAARAIITDLKSRNIMLSKDQILEYDLFLEPSIHKTAELIYGALGESYKYNKDEAHKQYKRSMNIKFYKMDKNANAIMEPRERAVNTGFIKR